MKSNAAAFSIAASLFAFLSSNVVVLADKPDLTAESFTCTGDLLLPDTAVVAGTQVYSDSTSYTIKALNHMSSTDDIYIVQGPLADATATNDVVAAFTSPQQVQYFLAIPISHDEGNPLEWMGTHWVPLADSDDIGATITVDNDGEEVSFALYTKQYSSSVAMSVGPNAGTEMYFVMYYGIDSNTDVGITAAGADTNVQAICTAKGDPHFTNFNGEREEDVGDGSFYHMLQAKDCAFDIQVMARNPNGDDSFMAQTAIRFYQDVFFYSHDDEKIVKQIIHEDGTSEILDSDEGKIISNNDLGIEVRVGPGQFGVEIYLEQGFYQMNSNGLCGTASNANPLAGLYDIAGTNDICGDSNLDGVDERHKHPVDEQNVLWNMQDTFEDMEDPQANTCTRQYCVDPSMPVGLEDPEILETTRCAVVAGDAGTIMTDSVPDSECAAFNTGNACADISADIIAEGMTKCREMLLVNPWKSDCNCMNDFCLSNGTDDPEIADVADAPCLLKDVNEANIVKGVNGYDYATLDFASPTSTEEECQANSFLDATGAVQKYGLVPYGWDIVPADDTDNVNLVLQSNSFGTKCIFTAADEPFAIGGYTECGTHKLLVRIDEEIFRCLAVTHCPSRVLIRRVTGVTLSQDTPSLIGWEASVDGNVQGVVGNRGYIGKTLNEWVDSSMKDSEGKFSKIVYDLAAANNLVLNFARDATENKNYMCLMGGNTVESSTHKIEAMEISTSPLYPMFWMVQENLGGGDSFLPVLHGSTLSSHHEFTEGNAPHAMCVGPLDTDGKKCVTLKLSGVEGLEKLHVVGPQADAETPLHSVTEHDLTSDFEITFCPHLSEEAYGLSGDDQCKDEL